MIWAQVGFAMVLLSAAVKGLADDTLEAGRIDGASERTNLFRIVVPQIWPTVITVFITVLITVTKIFDIIYATTGGNLNTDVIGMRFYSELFTNGNNGYAAAIVVMLLLAVMPVLVHQVRHFRAQEGPAAAGPRTRRRAIRRTVSGGAGAHPSARCWAAPGRCAR